MLAHEFERAWSCVATTKSSAHCRPKLAAILRLLAIDLGIAARPTTEKKRKSAATAADQLGQSYTCGDICSCLALLVCLASFSQS